MKLPGYFDFKKYPKTPLKQLFTAASNDTLDLLEKMFMYDPQKRITAYQSLMHPYFKSNPLPADPAKMPRVLPKKEVVAEAVKRKAEDDEVAKKLFKKK